MIWFGKKHSRRIDPDDLSRQAEESLKTTREQQPQVSALTNYLTARKNQNGFGEDFEYTLRAKGAQ